MVQAEWMRYYAALYHDGLYIGRKKGEAAGVVAIRLRGILLISPRDYQETGMHIKFAGQWVYNATEILS